MAKAPPSFDFYFNDWLGGVQDLGPEDERHYLRLLIYQWQNGFIPKSKIARMNVCGVADQGWWDAIWGRIQHKFVPIELNDGSNEVVFVQERMYRDRQRAIVKWLRNTEIRDKRVMAGKLGGRPKSKSKANALAKRKQTKASVEGGRGKVEELNLKDIVNGMPEKLGAAVEGWITYKAERKESYKPQGLRALATQIQKAADKEGVDAVIDAIELAESSGWKGWSHGLSNGSPRKRKQEIYVHIPKDQRS